MMKILTILFFCSQTVFATNYYVDNAGNDVNNGLTAGTAWKTIAKVNSSSFSSGDSILLKCGGSWNEQLNISWAGVIVSSYGAGVKPILTGFQTVTGFTNYSGNIWVASIPYSVAKLNTVLIDGKIRAKGRYPNTGYLTLTSNVGKGQITGSLTGTPDYTGAECVVRSAHWILDVVKILSQSGGTLTFRDSLTYSPLPLGGNGYFIQNSIAVLDTLGEWAFDSTAKKIYVYATSSPTVQVSTIDTVIYSHKANVVSINGLQILGANKVGIYLDSCRFDTIRNCSISNSGSFAIAGVSSAHTFMQYDTTLNTLSNGIFFRELSGYFGLNQTCDSSTIDNCLIKNTGYLAGMGRNANGMYIGINIAGHNQIITNNRLDSTGFNGIVWYGRRSLLKYNYITTSCFVKDDGGGINTGIAPNFPDTYDTGSVVSNNIIVDIIGATSGAQFAQQASGIMLDQATTKVTLDSNTIINPFVCGVLQNDGRKNKVTNNTVIGNRASLLYISGSGGSIYYTGNVLYSQDSAQPCVSFVFYDSTGISNDNYFIRPLKQTGLLQWGAFYSLPAWTVKTKYDSNSVLMPAHTASALPIIAINPTHSDSTITLSGLYIDAKGGTHNNSATIYPFGSLILFKADYEIYKSGFSIGNLKFSTQ